MAESPPVFRCPHCGSLIPGRAVIEQLLPQQMRPEPDPGLKRATRRPTAADLAGLRTRIAAVAAAAAVVEDRVAATFQAAAQRRPARAEELRSTAEAATAQAARERRQAQSYGAALPAGTE